MAQETILIVEDQPDIQMTMRLTLERSGYNVMQAADADQAFEALAKCTPDLILLDLSLPKTSGWELLERIRSIPGLDATPVVVATGHVGEEVARRAGELGANGFLAKPFDIGLLNETVKRSISTEGRS